MYYFLFYLLHNPGIAAFGNVPLPSFRRRFDCPDVSHLAPFN
jgi:hypothetical protein